jgi:hypothetical protein
VGEAAWRRSRTLPLVGVVPSDRHTPLGRRDDTPPQQASVVVLFALFAPIGLGAARCTPVLGPPLMKEPLYGQRLQTHLHGFAFDAPCPSFGTAPPWS